MLMLIFVLLSLWRTPLSITVTPMDYFCNVCDWLTAQEIVSQGDMLGYNHTDLTYHDTPRNGPATHRSLAQVARQRATVMSEVPTWGKARWRWQTWRTGGWQGVPLRKTTPLSLSVTHAAASQHPSHLFLSLLLPVSGKSPPVKTCVRELNSDVLQVFHWQIRDRILVLTCPTTWHLVF